MPLGGVRGASPVLPSGRWDVNDVFAGRYGFIPISATGGTVTDITVNGVDYRIHTFTTVGSSSFVVSSLGTLGNEVEYLVVAGGGGAGGTNTVGGGGGGAGGYRSSVVGEPSGRGASAESRLTLPPDVYPVVVGAGGIGIAANATADGTPGGDSTFASITSLGGANSISGSGRPPTGGAGAGQRGNAFSLGGFGTAGQGRDGAGGTGSGNYTGGGGGGAAGNGATGSGSKGGNGGNGVTSTITGTGVTRAGGGGGGTSNYGSGTTPGGDGGAGGGGTGGTAVATGADGQPNTGGGGGGPGSTHSVLLKAGNGGSGIVIIRYPLQDI